MKKVIAEFLILTLLISPVFALKDVVKSNVRMGNSFESKNFSQSAQFSLDKDININGISLAKNTEVKVEVLQAQKERRWHKSGFFVCKLKSYKIDNSEIDVSDKDIFFIVRRYEKIDKKEAAILATEIILTQAASCFAPGVDILYFFTKGAIQRKKHDNWFKAGVYNAWDNSIFWFQQKGKDIELAQNDEATIKSITSKRAYQLQDQVTRRRYKADFRQDRKALKKDIKEIDKLAQQEEYNYKYATKIAKKDEELINKIDKKISKYEMKTAKKFAKLEEKEFRKDLKEKEKLAKKLEKTLKREIQVSAKIGDNNYNFEDVKNETPVFSDELSEEYKQEYLKEYLEEKGFKIQDLTQEDLNKILDEIGRV